MKFNPCIIIPIYNHGKLLKSFIQDILAQGVPIILIDDGSEEKTKSILSDISNNQNITLYSLEKNQGKGSALIFGFNKIFESGYSHALQIDADNQHSVRDIPVFLELAQDNPESLINGCPIFDKTIPKSRLYGRKITNFWVALETISKDIDDAMCGFRVYPLKQLNSLIKRSDISSRMGFDIDIIVKLHWNKVNIINQATNVNYPENGTSHFRLIRDNLEISSLHAKLFLTMLFRLIIPTKKIKNDH